MDEDVRKMLEDHEKRISTLEKGSKPESKPRSKSSGKKGAGDLILELKSEGFFKEEKTNSQINAALQARGKIAKSKDLSVYLLGFVRNGTLKRRQIITGKKKSWVYFA